MLHKVNELLTDRLNAAVSIEDANTIIGIIDNLNKKVENLPDLIKSLASAKEQLLYEQEANTARGGEAILSSMIEE